MMVVVLDEIERGNSVEEADEAVLLLGLPMAPSVLLQMVGEQVANHVRETLPGGYPDRFAITRDGPARSVEEIRDAVLEALADETRHMLEEGVVESPKDVDTALILGAGFPFFMGGLTRSGSTRPVTRTNRPARPPRAKNSRRRSARKAMLRIATLTGEFRARPLSFSGGNAADRAAYMQETTEQRTTTPAADELVAAAQERLRLGRRAASPQRRGAGRGSRARNGAP